MYKLLLQWESFCFVLHTSENAKIKTITFKKKTNNQQAAKKTKLEPGTNLEEACEDVKLKHGNVVIAGEVNRRFKGHCFQA